jgi:hypothetical protein
MAAVEAAGLQLRRTRVRGKKRTHCKRGHKLEPPNVYARSDGGRQCYRCILERHDAQRRARGVPERPGKRKPRPWDEDSQDPEVDQDGRRLEACLP